MTQSTDPAALIRGGRACLGLTQEKFAARLGGVLPTINRWEAARSNAVPVGLMNGEQLVALLAEYSICITRRTHDIIELDEQEPGSPEGGVA